MTLSMKNVKERKDLSGNPFSRFSKHTICVLMKLSPGSLFTGLGFAGKKSKLYCKKRMDISSLFPVFYINRPITVVLFEQFLSFDSV